MFSSEIESTNEDQSLKRRIPLEVEDDDDEMGEMVGPTGDDFNSSDDENLGEPLDFSRYGVGRPLEEQQDDSDGEDDGLVEIMVPGRKT